MLGCKRDLRFAHVVTINTRDNTKVLKYEVQFMNVVVFNMYQLLAQVLLVDTLVKSRNSVVTVYL